MRILVTGGAGFIGNVTVEQLLARGHEVTVLEKLSDLWDRNLTLQILHREQIEAVIHLAASVHADAHQCFENNLSATIALLDSMLRARVKRLVFSSSTAVYGDPSELPVTEEAPRKPTSPYAASKLAVEQLLPWYDQVDLKYISLRYGIVSGATLKSGESSCAASDLISRILDVAEGRAAHLEIFGEDYPTPDGTCVRDYLHVLDVADALVLALSALEHGRRTYNLGSGCGYSVHEVVEIARQVTGCKIPTEPGRRRAGDPAILIASPDRIMSDLGWQPRNSELETIIKSAWRRRVSDREGGKA